MNKQHQQQYVDLYCVMSIHASGRRMQTNGYFAHIVTVDSHQHPFDETRIEQLADIDLPCICSHTQLGHRYLNLTKVAIGIQNPQPLSH
jgi:hypothetical protein